MIKEFIFVIVFFSCLIFFSCQLSKVQQEIRPKVTAIFPSADTLPENLLRMYIHFSKPMKTIGNLEKIKLMDEKGKEVVGAIFNNVHELWDSEQKQLTLIFDPSRVKTGLLVNEEKGRSLKAGKNYELVIEQLEDAEGNELKEVYTKSFVVSKEDRLSPNNALWELKIPKVNTRSPFVVRFPDILDRLSLLQRLQLTNQNTESIKGQVEIHNQETEWHFLSAKKWLPGDYILYFHGRLEDPCGNNLNGLFEHKTGSLKNEEEEFIGQINLKITK